MKKELSKFIVNKIDFDSPEQKKRTEDILRQQEEILARKRVDWNKLNKLTINI